MTTFAGMTRRWWAIDRLLADRQRNVELLKGREWFDIPLVYLNKRRGILAIEKGSSGDRVFADALAAWDRDQ